MPIAPRADVQYAFTMYLDKPRAGHKLMQAIARVNPVYGEMPSVLIVDLIGLADALATYANATGGRDKPVNVLRVYLGAIDHLFIGRRTGRCRADGSAGWRGDRVSAAGSELFHLFLPPALQQMNLVPEKLDFIPPDEDADAWRIPQSLVTTVDGREWLYLFSAT